MLILIKFKYFNALIYTYNYSIMIYTYNYSIMRENVNWILKKQKEIYFESIKNNHILNDRCDSWLTLTPCLMIFDFFLHSFRLFDIFNDYLLLCFLRILTPTLYWQNFQAGNDVHSGSKNVCNLFSLLSISRDFPDKSTQ